MDVKKEIERILADQAESLSLSQDSIVKTSKESRIWNDLLDSWMFLLSQRPVSLPLSLFLVILWQVAAQIDHLGSFALARRAAGHSQRQWRNPAVGSGTTQQAT